MIPPSAVYTPPMSIRPLGSSRKPARGRWWGLVLGLAVVWGAGGARAETVERKPSESDDDFVARVLGTPAEDLAQKIVRSTEIAGGKLTLIAFVHPEDESTDQSQGGDTLAGHLLIETSPNRYEHVKFTSCAGGGGIPDLKAVFYARTTKAAGGTRNLAVLCGWEHGGPVSNGVCFGAEFYRLEEKSSKWVAEPMTDLNAKFVTCEVADADKRGKWVHQTKAKFSTVAEVKKLLTKMGLKQ